MKVLVTGACGFIGYHLCKRLIADNIEIVGIDNFNSFYDPKLKDSRLKELNKISQKNKFNIFRNDILDSDALKNIFRNFKPEFVVNLAAQAGVRYSINNPNEYIRSNLVGFANVLECCRLHKVKHLIYASSSSVYGGNTSMPFSENHQVDHPISIYAATKKSNELMAHSYSHLFGIPSTGVRFFTCYGPWGRPDMALFLFTKSIIEEKPIKIFNYGKMTRDFTYIDDIVESLIRIIEKPPSPDESFNTDHPNPSDSWAAYKILNIGNSNSTSLMDYIEAIESSLGKKAKKEYLPLQKGDVPATFADCKKLENWINYKPQTPVEIGVEKFINWYREFYKV